MPPGVCRQTPASQRNRTIKEATVKRFHDDDHDQPRNHMANFISACNFGRRLKALKGLTPHEVICKQWTIEPERFTLNPIHQMPGLNGSATADGAYDTRGCHTAFLDRNATAIIPIRKNGRLWREDGPAAVARNSILRDLREEGRAGWKRRNGHHVRSRAEARVRCLNAFGERIAARDPDRQTAETHIRVLRRLSRTIGVHLLSHQPLQRTRYRRDRPLRLTSTGKGASRRKPDQRTLAVTGCNTVEGIGCDVSGAAQLAFAEWAAAGLALPDLGRMREYRWDRLVQAIVARGHAGLLMFDPLNIRHATDTTNMQLWNTHNPFRACLICADGHMVMWEYKNAPFLVAFNPLVKELRSGATFFYNSTGDRGAAAAQGFAAQVDEVIREHAGTNRRLAVDKIMVHGLRALEAIGFQVLEGEELTERVRAIKGPDDIPAMRAAHHACEQGIAEMEAFTRANVPGGGVSEDAIWAELHAANIRRGGEWIETRLLASGPRTNPWFQECSPRLVRPDGIVAFDTDLIGCYGMCIDISRTWWIGDGRPSNAMRSAFAHALDHIRDHQARLKPGVSIRDLVFGGHRLAPEYWRQKYACKMHGVGLCDEWPYVHYPDGWIEGAFDAELEPGMVLCVEALVSPEGGDFSIKLEDQVLITETGCENLTRYPFDAALTGG